MIGMNGKAVVPQFDPETTPPAAHINDQRLRLLLLESALLQGLLGPIYESQDDESS